MVTASSSADASRSPRSMSTAPSRLRSRRANPTARLRSTGVSRPWRTSVSPRRFSRTVVSALSMFPRRKRTPHRSSSRTNERTPVRRPTYRPRRTPGRTPSQSAPCMPAIPRGSYTGCDFSRTRGRPPAFILPGRNHARATPAVERRPGRGEPSARRLPLRLERPALGRVLVHDAAGHGPLPLAVVLVPGVARRAVGPRARGLARRRDRVPPRPAHRRLRRHRRRLDRLLVRQPPHLVRLARAAGHDRAGPLRRAERGGREVAGAPHRRGRRGAEARAGARRDDGGREGPRLHLASHGPGPVPRPGPRGGGPRGRELRRLLPRGPGPRACATPPSTGTRASPGRRSRGSRSRRRRSPISGRA